jgi:hypothetical protein
VRWSFLVNVVGGLLAGMVLLIPAEAKAFPSEHSVACSAAFCPVGARLIGGECYCYTTGKQIAVEPKGICPENPACDRAVGTLCDGNFDCCCSIQNKIHRGEICKGCMQLSQSSCEYTWPH